MRRSSGLSQTELLVSCAAVVEIAGPRMWVSSLSGERALQMLRRMPPADSALPNFLRRPPRFNSSLSFSSLHQKFGIDPLPGREYISLTFLKT